MTHLIFILFISSSVYAEDCQKSITVQGVFKRSHPNPFQKVLEPERLGETRDMNISCSLYKEIAVGDLLKNKDEEISSFRLFSGDGGTLERKYYKVLKK